MQRVFVMQRNIQPIAILLLLLLLPLTAVVVGSGGCAAPTNLSTTWKNPDATAPLSFKKVVVIALNSTPGERRAQEDELVRNITQTTAVPSYTIVPDSDLQNVEKVKQAVRQAGFDGAVVLRLIDSKTQQTYIPGTTSYWDGGGYASWMQSPGYYTNDTIVRAEVSLYSVADGKLIWSGSSTTTNPNSAKELATQVARAGTEELRKQGLLH